MTNPGYMDSVLDGNDLYTQNCQRCIWAYELLRRGYSVEAKSWNPGDDQKGFGKSSPNYANSFANVSTVPLDFSHVIGTPWRPALANDINRYILQNFPEGSRGALVMWRRSPAGHVVNWEISNGKVQIYDGQPGEKSSISSLKAHGGVMFAADRMDDKEINLNLINDYVERTKVLHL